MLLIRLESSHLKTGVLDPPERTFFPSRTPHIIGATMDCPEFSGDFLQLLIRHTSLAGGFSTFFMYL